MTDPASPQSAPGAASSSAPDAASSSSSSSRAVVVWFDRLADVEAQCVMTFCCAHDLLHLARTCRRLHHLANAPFPWRHLLHNLGVTPVALWNRHEHRGLISHAPLGLAFSVFPPESAKHKESLSLEALISHPLPNRLHRLDAGEASSLLQSFHWVVVLSSPQVAQLRVLVIHDMNSSCKLSKDLMAAIVALRHLHTLHIAPAGGTGVRLAELTACPALTNLTVRDLPKTVLRHFDGCTGLVRLSVSAPSLYKTGSLFDLFDAPYAPRLEHLAFESAHLMNLPKSSWDQAFFALKSLRTFRMEHCRGMDVILPHVWNAPLLREVTLVLDFGASHHNILPRDSLLPSVGSIAQMLASSSRLYLRLESAVSILGRKDAREEWGHRIEAAVELDSFRDRIAIVHRPDAWKPPVELQFR